jgi:hypothetical protein
MFAYLLLIMSLLLGSSQSFADASDVKPVDPTCKVPQQEKVCTPPKPKAPQPKVVVKQAPPVQPEKQEMTQTQSQSSTASATTGNQSVNINFNEPSLIYANRPKYRLVTKETANPNRLLLMLGTSFSDVTASKVDCDTVRTTRKYQPDIGVQYIRDIGRFSASGMATFRQNMYIGFGLNF